MALVAGGYNITDTYAEFLGEDGLAEYVESLNAARQREFETGEVQYMPAVAGPPDYAPAAMPVQEAYACYTRARDQEAPNRENRISTASMEHIVGWNVIGHASRVTQPLLIVHGRTDVLLPPRYVQEAYDRAPEPKQLEWIDTDNHVQLYDQQPYVTEALEHIVAFLDAHLSPSPDAVQVVVS